ncbi:SixA phosphatase family protein [Vulgatibacter sp.]|uniref:SixA phosphatase family protein n=1 Tax=Vulgatibacter sp. TaxID=1971226 RepID=UPI003566E348
MRVYLVRHGIAAPGGTELDEHRPLTDDGRRLFRLSAAIWAEQGGSPTRWIVSPLVRAVQTCEIGLAAFGLDGPVEVTTALAPDARVSAAAQLVDDRYGETLALVGHLPLIGALAAFLLGLRSVPAPLQPGAILALDLPEGEGAPRLAWHLVPGEPPKLLVPPA